MCGGILHTGVPTEAELKHAPGIPVSAEIRPGGTAWIECLQTIACNPCEANCPVGAISIGPKIASLPRLDPEKCIGCGTCVTKCPGLAISVIAFRKDSGTTVLSIPYEYFPLPETGSTVHAVDRAGQYVCDAQVLRVLPRDERRSTCVIKISFPEKYAYQVKSINTFHWR